MYALIDRRFRFAANGTFRRDTVFGFITYVLVRLTQRRWRKVHPLMYAIALGFAVYFAVPLLRQEFGFH